MKLKKTFRAVLLAETMNNVEREALGKEPVSFRLTTQQEIAYYLYAIYKTSVEDITYDSFLEKMDDDRFAKEITAWMAKDLAESELTDTKKKELG